MCIDTCHQIANKSPSNCHQIAIKSPSNRHQIAIKFCHQIAIKLPLNCHQIAIKSPSNRAITNVILRDLLFSVECFKRYYVGKGESKRKNAWYGRYRFRYRFLYMPWNGTVTKVVLCDRDLLLQGRILQMLISLKRWKLGQKERHTEFTEFDLFSVEWRNLESNTP